MESHLSKEFSEGLRQVLKRLRKSKDPVRLHRSAVAKASQIARMNYATMRLEMQARNLNPTAYLRPKFSYKIPSGPSIYAAAMREKFKGLGF